MKLVLGALCAALLASGASASCRVDSVDLRGTFGTASFDVEVADDPRERARGLMFVEELGASEGMLFVYERPQPAAFWMRNTLIPLDMIFMGEDGTVTHIHENAIPLDETPIPGGDEVRYVLEVPGGTVERLGIEIGAELRHPSIEPEPAWPCD